MKWFAHLFAHALARRIAYVVVALLLAWVGIGRAEAQTASCVLQTGSGYASTWVNCASREDAYNKASELAALIPANYLQGKCTPWEIASRPVQWNGAKAYTAGAANANGCTWKPGLASWPGAECPIGKSWDDAKKRCAVQCPGGFGEDPYNPGQCMDEDKCTARNSSINTSALRIGGDTCVNLGGCAFEADTSGSVSAATSEASLTMYPYSYSGRPGSACAAPPPPDPEPPEPKPECIPAGGGQTMCIRPDGQHCYSSAPGKSSGFCWKPGETGEQTQGPDRQDRKPGTDPPPPNLNLNNGDTLQPKPGGPITSTTNTGGNTIITTVINYGTTNGTNAGSGSGKGDSGTGDISKPGGGGNDTGGGGGDGTSASGGADCKSPPIVQGDAALNMVATQAWATRCAVVAGHAVKVTGDVSNCAQPYTVVGDTSGMQQGENRASVEKLKSLRAMICGSYDASQEAKATDVDGEAAAAKAAGAEAAPGAYTGQDGTWKDGDDPLAGARVNRDSNWLIDQLDPSGFFGGSADCPSLPSFSVGPMNFSLSMGPMCTLLASLGQIVLALAYFRAFKIMAA